MRKTRRKILCSHRARIFPSENQEENPSARIELAFSFGKQGGFKMSGITVERPAHKQVKITEGFWAGQLEKIHHVTV